MNNKALRPRAVAIVLGAAGLVGIGVASAAQLLVNGTGAGSTVEVVAACQNDGTPINVDYGTGFAAEYTVTSLSFTGIDSDCEGKDLSLTLTDTFDDVLATAGPVVVSTGGTGSQSVTLTTPVSVEDFANLAVLIA